VATGRVPVGTKMKKLSAIFTAAVVILVLCGSGCNHTEQENVAEPSPPVAQPSPAASAAPEWMAAGATHRVADITGDPKAFIGKTVTVVAEVDEVYGPRAFTLDVEDEDLSGAKSAEKGLLTLVPKVGGFPKVDAQWKDGKARVTGVVQLMEPKYIEREIGWGMPSSLKSRFKGRPALIVRSVERLPQ
jgi:hypothetical protein